MPASRLGQPPVLPQQRQHRLVRQRAHDASLAARRVDRRPERVEHRLLGRLDGGGEERVQVTVGNDGRSTRSGGASSRSVAAVENATKISPLP